MPAHTQQQNTSQQASSNKTSQAEPMQQLEQEYAEILDLQQTAGNHAVQRLLSDPDTPVTTPTTARRVARLSDDPVELDNVSLNHNRVTTPPTAGLSLSASKVPANATDVTFLLQGRTATVDGGTSIDSDSGAITLSGSQTGGVVDVGAEQQIESEEAIDTITKYVALHLAGVPSGITGTQAEDGSSGSRYGGRFTHTFTGAGGSTAMYRAHVNEQFGEGGTSFSWNSEAIPIEVNAPNDAGAGWDLGENGQMTGTDNVTWPKRLSAVPFIPNASNPTPAETLPHEVNITQNFRNLNLPGQSYSDTGISTTHRRAIVESSGFLYAVTGAGGQEVEQDYVGPTAYRNATAEPDTLEAGSDATSQISVEVLGPDQAPHYAIQGETHGCRVNRTTGEFAVGSEAGEVVVQAGRAGNYDAVTITVTEPPGEESTEETAEQATPEAETEE